VGQVAARVTAQTAINLESEVIRRELKGEEVSLPDLAQSAAKNALIAEAGNIGIRLAARGVGQILGMAGEEAAEHGQPPRTSRPLQVAQENEAEAGSKMREEAPPAKSNSTENPAGIPTQRITPAVESPGGLGQGTTGGIPNNIAASELGPLLGRGGNKDVYAFGDTQAVGVLRHGKNPADLNKELALLRQLEELGLPTVNARGPIKVDEQPALLFDRFAQGSKDIVRLRDRRVRIVGESSLLNEQSISDLQTIRQIIVNNKIRINDLQFLIGSDGRVVIADPLGVQVGIPPSSNNLDMIDLLIQAARKNVR
jgi:hypothetical protein